MRRAIVASLLLSIASPSSAFPTRASRTVVFGAARESAIVNTLPAEPWRSLQRVELPSPCATAAVRLPDGTIVVGLDAPPGIAFVSRGGDVVTSVRVPGRISRPLSVGLDGRLFVTIGRSVITVAPDGTQRSVTDLADAPETQVFVRADWTAVAVTTPGGALEFVTLSPRGDTVRSSSMQASPLTAPVALDDGRIALATSNRLVTFDTDGHLATALVPAGVRRIAGQSGIIALATGSDLLLADSRLVVRASVPLPGAPSWLAGVGGGRFGIALPIINAPTQLWIIDRDATVTARTPLPPETSAPLVDDTGAMAIVSRGGEVLTLAPDGHERWRVSLRENLRPPAAALPRGGLAIATEGNTLLLVTDAPR